MFYTPCMHGHTGQSLDDLMLIFGSLWKKAEACFKTLPTNLDQLHVVEEEVRALDGALSIWQKTRSKEIRPKEIGRVSQNRSIASNCGVGYWPGRVDKYFDLYNAGVWNISRAARLLLIFLMLRLSEMGGDNTAHIQERKNAFSLVEDVIASIQYHLTEDIHSFIQDIETITEISNTGRSVGGLLLMHPIYIISLLSMVPSNIREYMKNCLAWIGTHMGIGQAALFAKVRFLLGICHSSCFQLIIIRDLQ